MSAQTGVFAEVFLQVKPLTPEQMTTLLTALEWAGEKDSEDGILMVCLVCGNERHGGKPFSGHEPWCAYAEVFYK